MRWRTDADSLFGQRIVDALFFRLQRHANDLCATPLELSHRLTLRHFSLDDMVLGNETTGAPGWLLTEDLFVPGNATSQAGAQLKTVR